MPVSDDRLDELANQVPYIALLKTVAVPLFEEMQKTALTSASLQEDVATGISRLARSILNRTGPIDVETDEEYFALSDKIAQMALRRIAMAFYKEVARW